ncbi:unnamed protein product [Durusdinium trenchii]
MKMVVHRFGLDEKLVFLGKDDKLFGVGLKADQSTPQEILSCGTRPRPWELQAQRRQDVTSVHITGTAQEALVLNHTLELFSMHATGSEMLRLLPSKKVIQLACSDEHYLALTTDGQVYPCGSNQYGQLGLGNTSPVQELGQAVVSLQTDAGSQRFATFVACGRWHSVVICEQESLHTFGNGDYAQCGNGGQNTFTPKCLGCSEQIVKACCGSNHSLFLSSIGDLYGCGSGQIGQLGAHLRSSHNYSKVKLPETVRGRVIDIFANPMLEVSVLMDEHGVFHLAGAANELLGSRHVIEDFLPWESKSLVVGSRFVCMQPVTQRYRAPFDLPDACDICILVQDQKTPIYFGWDTIRFRSLFLTKMVQNSKMDHVHKLEDGRVELKIQNYSWKAIQAYGKYLHEDEVEGADPQTLLELLKLADEYGDETGLQGLCASALRRSVNSENLCSFLEHCIKMDLLTLASDCVEQGLTLSNVCGVLNLTACPEDQDAAVMDTAVMSMMRYIQDICIAFAAQHATVFVEDTNFANLQPKIAKKFVSKLSSMKLLKT